MEVTRHFGLGGLAGAVLLLACGDDGKDKATTSGDAGQSGGQPAAPIIEIAQLADNTSGSACTTEADCKGTGAICLDGTCTGVCESNKNCGAGGSCVQVIAGQNGLCGKVCNEDTECGAGLACRAGLDFGDVFSLARDAGIEGIDAGVDLRNIPKTCGPSLGIVQLPDGVVSKPCTNDSACAPGQCETNLYIFEPLPNGYCSGKCLADSDCGSGAVCFKDIATQIAGLDGRCLLPCSGGSACPHSLVCRVSAWLDSRSFCLPPVANPAAADGGS
jgi:Cys-rich repeat protein